MAFRYVDGKPGEGLHIFAKERQKEGESGETLARLAGTASNSHYDFMDANHQACALTS